LFFGSRLARREDRLPMSRPVEADGTRLFQPTHGSRGNRRAGGALPRYRRSSAMTIGLVHLQPLVALIAGILILLVPRLLNFIVAIYLIIVGVTGLLH
jgi:hypothetical protein